MTDFSKKLLTWHETVERELPWKKTNDPYRIWLSEIILQQTRVAQGTPYYLEFVRKYPTVFDLASASEDDVMKTWQGLGYYSRARNLHHTAKTIVEKFGGNFPNNYKEILSLKGIGPYTAAAISSFAFGLRHPVVDGNVLRLISRYQGITAPIDDTQTVKQIKSIVEKHIEKPDPAAFNQAIMDFGAMVCIPRNPDCNNCVFATDCVAYAQDLVETIPYKAKKVKKRNRYFHYFDITLADNQTILHQRTGKDIWQQLYEFPKIEKENDENLQKQEIQQYLAVKFGAEPTSIQQMSKRFKHLLTHQTIYVDFYKIEIADNVEIKKPFYLVDTEKVSNFAFPQVIVNYRNENLLFKYLLKHIRDGK